LEAGVFEAAFGDVSGRAEGCVDETTLPIWESIVLSSDVPPIATTAVPPTTGAEVAPDGFVALPLKSSGFLGTLDLLRSFVLIVGLGVVEVVGRRADVEAVVD